ncbi:hypothetical protein EE612_048959, partial [Oryza sativa]
HSLVLRWHQKKGVQGSRIYLTIAYARGS